MSKLQYNPDAITDLTLIDQNNISGKIGDSDVIIRRRMSGWSVNLVIIVDDIVLHDSEAEADCRDFFHVIQTRAWTAKEERSKAVRSKALPAISKLITITDRPAGVYAGSHIAGSLDDKNNDN